MRPRRSYGAGFFLVLVAAILGAFLARQALGDASAPNLNGLSSVQSTLEDLNIWSLIPLPRVEPAATTAALVEEDAGQPAASTSPATPEPIQVAPVATGSVLSVTVPAEATTEAAGEPAVAPVGTDTPVPPLPTPTPTTSSAMPYVAAGAVLNTSDNCPGASIRGVVRDSAGNPLAGVRLWRYDQWGNEQVVESKAGDADLGNYDFPLSDTPNVHYIQVVDSAGVIVSPVIEIQHRQGQSPDDACHFLDWVRR